jgi:glycosyltransferase involved in cell wall biosynthesis
MERKQGISLIMPVYHDGIRERQMEYLIEAIDSIVRARSHPKMPFHELMIVDDGSKDPQTKLYLETLARDHDWIKFIPLETNGGPSRARNTAIKHSSFDHIAGIDCDDIIKQNYAEFLSKAISLLSKDPDLTSVAPGMETIEKYPRRINKMGDVKLWDSILYYCANPTQSVYRYIDIERAGLYREDSIRAEDWKLCIDVMARRHEVGLQNRLIVTDVNYYKYRQYSDGSSVNSRPLSEENLVRFLVSGNEAYYKKLWRTSDINTLLKKINIYELNEIKEGQTLPSILKAVFTNLMHHPVRTIQDHASRSRKLKSLFNILGINRSVSKPSQTPSTDFQPN